MTFSLAIRCAKSGAFGVAGTTSSIAVGARCLFIDAGAGAVITQHRTDPRLGPKGLDLLRAGASAQDCLDQLVASTPYAGWRELAVVDAQGGTAAHQGAHQEPLYAQASAPGIVAVGNILRDMRVPEAMVAAALSAKDKPLAERLILALQAGLAAGGEIFALKSAALQVAEHPGFSAVDLRVDLSQDPIGDLATLWQAYQPHQAQFVSRVLDPDAGGRATCSQDLLAAEGISA